jgi:two-component system, LuxR family, response regulator FixJ
VEAENCIFIVEPDAALRASVVAVAASLSAQIRQYASGEEFLAACGRPQCGCLIAAIRLPGLSGLRLMQVMRQNGIRLPTIIIGASIDVRLAVRFLHAGAVTVLEIPFRDQELWDAIHEAWELNSRIRSKEANPAAVRPPLPPPSGDIERRPDREDDRTSA